MQAPLHGPTTHSGQVRAAETELLGLLEQEEAKASKRQQKKAKKKGKRKDIGGKEAGWGADGAVAGLAAMSLADSDGEEEKTVGG